MLMWSQALFSDATRSYEPFMKGSMCGYGSLQKSKGESDTPSPTGVSRMLIRRSLAEVDVRVDKEEVSMRQHFDESCDDRLNEY